MAAVSSTSYPFPVSSANTRRRGLKAVIGRGPGSLVKPSRITSVQPNQPDCLQFADLISLLLLLRPSQLSLPSPFPHIPLRAPFVSPLSSDLAHSPISDHEEFRDFSKEGRKKGSVSNLRNCSIIVVNSSLVVRLIIQTMLSGCNLSPLSRYISRSRSISRLAHYREWAFRKNTSLFPLHSSSVMHVNLPSRARVPFVPVCVRSREILGG